MQQRVSSERFASRAPMAGTKAPPAPRKRISPAARLFYLMRWAYHFITPFGMIGILYGIFVETPNDPTRGAIVIAGFSAFTYLANYFNKAR